MFSPSPDLLSSLKAKCVLVTGTSSPKGIGRAIAHAFAEQGAHVACVDRDLTGSEELAGELIERFGIKAVAFGADVGQPEQVLAVVEGAVARLGRINVLVNNAGFIRFRPFLEIDQELWDSTMNVNLRACFLFAQAGAKQMIKQGQGGAIINISSLSAVIAGEQKVHYCVSKAGLKMLTEGMALELSRHKIRVNAIAPGDVDTNIIQDEEVRRRLKDIDMNSLSPIGRRGRGADIAAAALFLASESAGFITGASLAVDGGATCGSLMPGDET